MRWMSINIPGQDIGQIVENARNAVRGKGLEEALEAFVNLSHTKAKKLRENAIKNYFNNSPLQAISF